MYDQTDERGIPVSRGFPPIVIASTVVGIVIIFTMITLVFANSAFGHVWPSLDSVQIPLSK